MAALCVLLAGLAAAEENQALVEPAAKLYRAGIVFYSQLSRKPPPTEAASLLEKAIEQFRQATQLRPDYFEAQALWAVSLFKLVEFRHDLQQPYEEQRRSR